MTRTRVGLITIGQSPRSDVVPAISELLGDSAEVIEVGCLDGMDDAELAALRPRPNDYVLTSRLADGRPVIVSRETIGDLVAKTIHRLANDGVRLIAILGMGEFVDRVTINNVTVIYPYRIFANWVAGVLGGGTLGVLFPLQEQRAQTINRWQPLSKRIVIEPVSPYGPADPVDALTTAAKKFRDQQVDLVVMDNIGYTPAMKALVRTITDRPVIAGYSVLGRCLAELV